MTIRLATEADLDAIAAMAVELVRMHHALDPDRFLVARTGMVEGYRGWLASQRGQPDAVLLTDEHAGSLRGYLFGRMEPRNWMELLDRHAALIDVYVVPDARRHGVGRALVEAFVAEAASRGAPRVVLRTAAKNEGAQALFRSLGFRDTMIEMTLELPGGPRTKRRAAG